LKSRQFEISPIPPIYFGTDFEAVDHFSQSSISIIEKKTVLFCTTPYQSELLTPIIIVPPVEPVVTF
jgi:hypothetical protein